MKKKQVKRFQDDDNEEWIQRKRQEFFMLKNALARFEWGSSYLPEACHSELYHIRRAIDRMDEPIKFWEAVK